MESKKKNKNTSKSSSKKIIKIDFDRYNKKIHDYFMDIIDEIMEDIGFNISTLLKDFNDNQYKSNVNFFIFDSDTIELLFKIEASRTDGTNPVQIDYPINQTKITNIISSTSIDNNEEMKITTAKTSYDFISKLSLYNDPTQFIESSCNANFAIEEIDCNIYIASAWVKANRKLDISQKSEIKFNENEDRISPLSPINSNT